MSTAIVTVVAFAPLSLGVTALAVHVAGPMLPLRRRPARYDWPVWSATPGGGPRRQRHRGRHRGDTVALAWRRRLDLGALADTAPVRVRLVVARRRLRADWRTLTRISLPGGAR